MTSPAVPDDELHRLRAEVERLRADNARLAELLDMAQDFGRLGVWERDPQTLQGRWDAHVFRFFGYTPGDTPNFLDAAARIHPDDRRPDEVRATLGIPGNHESRYRVLRPDGTVCHVHSHWRVVADDGGRPVRAIGVMVDDTATREHAERAQAEQAQLELALALSRIGLWRHDLGSGLLYHDERAQAMIGQSAGAQGVPLETVRSWIHPDDRAEVQAALDATLAGGGPVDTQTRYRHPSGQWRTVLTRRLLMRDAAAKPSTILGVALDVTEQQRRVTDAMALARRFEDAAQAARVGLWSGAIDARRPEWNAYMWTLLARDRSREPLTLGEALREYTPAEDRDRIAALAMDWLAGPPRPLDFEMRIRRDDGELRWVQLRAQRDLDEDGCERAFGIMLDVTERHDAMERLRVANERTSLALSAVGMGTWSQDTLDDGNAHWDEQMFRLRGLAPAAAAPDRAHRLALVAPEDRAALDALGVEFNRSAEPMSYEFRIRRADDGAQRIIASRSIALTDAQGRVTRRIGINWDVTELRSLESVQRERELALRESRTKSALFARISHELRTPLNAVLGFAQLMQAEDARATPAQRSQRLNQIQTAGKALLALVDNVLDLSEQAEMLRDTVRTPVPLAEAVDNAVAQLAQAAAKRDVQIEFGNLGPVVAADERRLQQLLVQLLGNAIKFSRARGAVKLHARSDAREAVLSIEDSGPGIDAERARRLFEPFEGPGGSAHGIGLALGQSLAQRMGGRIELARTGPQGSVFELRLPLAAVQSPPPASANAPSLLYIEDNEVNMLIVRELLAQRPHLRFHGAGDGASGVRAARELKPGLVLIDMQLPDIDGTEVLRRLRADPLTASIRCVALSANAMPEDVARARAAGFDDYWTKPIEMAAFLRGLDRLMPSPA